MSQDFVMPRREPPTGVALDAEDWILKVRTVVPVVDQHGDGVPDRTDDRPSVANGSQAGFDGDHLRKAYDPDDDSDLIPDALDCAPFDASAGRPPGVARTVVALAHVSWDAAQGAQRYDVSRGVLGASRSGEYGVCLVDSFQGTSVPDPTIRPAGDGRRVTGDG